MQLQNRMWKKKIVFVLPVSLSTRAASFCVCGSVVTHSVSESENLHRPMDRGVKNGKMQLQNCTKMTRGLGVENAHSTMKIEWRKVLSWEEDKNLVRRVFVLMPSQPRGSYQGKIVCLFVSQSVGRSVSLSVNQSVGQSVSQLVSQLASYLVGWLVG